MRLISLRITCMTPRMIADLPLRSSAAVTYRLLPWNEQPRFFPYADGLQGEKKWFKPGWNTRPPGWDDVAPSVERFQVSIKSI